MLARIGPHSRYLRFAYNRRAHGIRIGAGIKQDLYNVQKIPNSAFVIARSECDEAIHPSRLWIASFPQKILGSLAMTDKS